MQARTVTKLDKLRLYLGDAAHYFKEVPGAMLGRGVGGASLINAPHLSSGLS